MKYLILFLLPLYSHAAGKIINADIAPSGTANIARNKLATGTAYAWCTNDVSGYQTSTAVTASRAVATDANGLPTASATTATQLGYLSGASGTTGTTNLVYSSAPTLTNPVVGTQSAGDNSTKAASTAYVDAAGLTYWLLAGRSGGQTGYGGTGASDNATIRSTSNGTVGKVIIADQASETDRFGPTASASTFNITHEFLTTNGTSNATDGLAVRRNNLAAFNASSGTGNAAGILLTARGPSGAPEMRMVSTGGDQDAYIRLYDTGFGNLYGYFGIGSTFKFMNSNAALTTAWFSGTTGQTADIVKISNQSDGGNFVSSISSAGSFLSPAGSVTVPGFAFFGDTNNGWWAPAADTQAWTLAGVEKMRLSSSGLTVGVAGATTGLVNVTGSTSGTVTIQPQAAAGTYNFNLPTSAGSSGQPLLSGGGGSSAQTYGTLGVGAGGTGQTSYTDGQLLIGNTTGNTLAKSTLTAGTGISITNGSGSITITNSATGTTNAVASDTSGVKIYNATVTSGGSISYQSGSWISSVSSAGGGHYTLNLNASKFSSANISCTCSRNNSATGECSSTITNSTTIEIYMGNSSGTGTDLSFHAICMGPG